MPFQCPEYDIAFGQFIYETARELARARSPLLQQIRVVPTASTPSSVVDSREAGQLDLPGEPVELTLASDICSVRDGDSRVLVEALDEAADELGRALVGMFVATIDKVTEQTGNIVRGTGTGFDFELFIEALEKLEWTLDENDDLVIPQLVMHPDTAKELPAEPTPDQQARLDALKARKLEQLLARRRTRRLS